MPKEWRGKEHLLLLLQEDNKVNPSSLTKTLITPHPNPLPAGGERGLKEIFLFI